MVRKGEGLFRKGKNGCNWEGGPRVISKTKVEKGEGIRSARTYMLFPETLLVLKEGKGEILRRRAEERGAYQLAATPSFLGGGAFP